MDTSSAEQDSVAVGDEALKTRAAVADESAQIQKEDEDETMLFDEAETSIQPDKSPEVEPRPPSPSTTTKDRTLREFLGMMDQYAPIIPDAVTDYYLDLAGFECEDRRVKRLLALATQKFIADIAQDAYQYSKIRSSGGNTAGTSLPTQPRGRYAKDRGRAVLTMDDLGSAAHEYGINLKRQDFMR